jgi:hypothetical protein
MPTAFIILGACALILLPTLLFLLVVQPIWAFVEVCGATLLGRGAKILWLLLLLIFAIVASIPYALFVSASAALRQVTIVSLIITGILTGVGYGVMRSNPHLRHQFDSKVAEVRATYSQMKDLSETAKKLTW